MYPEDVYTLNWMLPRELSRPIAFNLARGLIQDKLVLHKMVREISIDEYRSYYIVSGDICWWVVIDEGELHCILMSDLEIIEDLGKRGGFSYMYLK